MATVQYSFDSGPHPDYMQTSMLSADPLYDSSKVFYVSYPAYAYMDMVESWSEAERIKHIVERFKSMHPTPGHYKVVTQQKNDPTGIVFRFMRMT